MPDSEDRMKSIPDQIDHHVDPKLFPPSGGVITMMFTDIEGSTPIKAEIGDEEYFERILKPHDELIRACLSSHHGQEYKHIGDSIFAGFSNPQDAVGCAVSIQAALTSSPLPAGSKGNLQVRIGLHTGNPKIYFDDNTKLFDLSGTDVDKAARVEGLANGGQVLISEETKVLAKPDSVHNWGYWELKGLGRNRIFEILWPGKSPEKPSGRLFLEPVRHLTPFIGREEEIARAMDAVRDHRLVILKGMGGIGKTRLASEIASRVRDSFEDGVFFAKLDYVPNQESAFVSELVSLLQVKTAGFPDEIEALCVFLQNKSPLLVLDNFEVVLSAAPVVRTLLKRCPAVRVLVTSQCSLGIEGEEEFEVTPMKVELEHPSELATLDSYQLFYNRARKKPAPGDIPEVTSILGLTDGIPLSIELAAAWVGRKTFSEIRQGLERKGREILSWAGAPPEDMRHASIQASLDWSYDLLSPEEKSLLPKLSVFAGGFFAEDVAEVCETEEAATLLDSLNQSSLVFRTESLGRSRYGMLSTVNDYGAKKLGEEKGKFIERHARHFLKVLEKSDTQLREKGGQREGLARISADLENFRQGLGAAIEKGDNPAVVGYSRAFAIYLLMTARFAENHRNSLQALEAAESLQGPQLIASCQHKLGVAYWNLSTGDWGENRKKASACFQAALRVFTEKEFPVDWAKAQNNLGNYYLNLPTGDHGENLKKGIACYEAALRVYTENDFPVDWAMVQRNLGGAYWGLPTGDRGENLKKAFACYEAGLRVISEEEFPVDWAKAQSKLGQAYTDLPTGDRRENLNKAFACFQAALRVFTEKEFPVRWARVQNNLGEAYTDLPTGDRGENLKKAFACFQAALRVFTEKDLPSYWAFTQENLGNAYTKLPTGDRGENLKKAIECYEMALRGCRAFGLQDEVARLDSLLSELKCEGNK